MRVHGDPSGPMMPSQAPVLLVIRYDDFLMPRTNGHPHDGMREIERCLAASHAQHNIPAVFAVVPKLLGASAEDWPVIEALKSACTSGSEIALHGYDHQNTLVPPKSSLLRPWMKLCHRLRSEFAGLPQQEQVRRLEWGQHRLAATFNKPVQTFVPPWNAYDGATVDACRQTGCLAISASRAWPVPRCEAPVLLPQTVHASHLAVAVDYALSRRARAAIVCVMHPFDFSLAEQDGRICVDRWMRDLVNLRACPAVSFQTVAQVAASFGHLLDSHRLRRHRRLSARVRLAATMRIGSPDPRRYVYPLD